MASLTAQGELWDQEYQNIESQNSACGELKNQADAQIKRFEAVDEILDWIRPDNDPEPLHRTLKERTGVTTTAAGNWFLEAPKFGSWIDQIRQGEKARTVFWLRGSSKYVPDILHTTVIIVSIEVAVKSTLCGVH